VAPVILLAAVPVLEEDVLLAVTKRVVDLVPMLVALVQPLAL
jgi:hypothetical protein